MKVKVTQSWSNFATPVTVSSGLPAHGILSRQDWSRVAISSPEDLPPDSRWIEPESPGLQADSLPCKLAGKPTLLLKILFIAKNANIQVLSKL